MNISTYEARIKALEDQLNPPGPSEGLVIESIKLSPDLGGINAILEDMTFDYESGASDESQPPWARTFEAGSATAETLPETIDVTVTPAEGLYAFARDIGGNTIYYGEIGSPATFTVHKKSGSPAFRIPVGAINTNDFQTADYGVIVSIAITHTAN